VVQKPAVVVDYNKIMEVDKNNSQLWRYKMTYEGLCKYYQIFWDITPCSLFTPDSKQSHQKHQRQLDFWYDAFQKLFQGYKKKFYMRICCLLVSKEEVGKFVLVYRLQKGSRSHFVSESTTQNKVCWIHDLQQPHTSKEVIPFLDVNTSIKFKYYKSIFCKYF
jgi:hypothetical protein